MDPNTTITSSVSPVSFTKSESRDKPNPFPAVDVRNTSTQMKTMGNFEQAHNFLRRKHECSDVVLNIKGKMYQVTDNEVKRVNPSQGLACLGEEARKIFNGDAPNKSYATSLTQTLHSAQEERRLEVESLKCIEKHIGSRKEINSFFIDTKNKMQLGMSDLKKGDVLFMNDKTSRVTHSAIFLAQLLTSLKPTDASHTHVCMYVGDGLIAEASGLGSIRLTNLCEKHGLKYDVFRFNEEIGEDAANEAKSQCTKQTENYGIYSLRGTGGLLRSSHYGEKARRDLDKLKNNHQFYKTHCSGFVGGILQTVDAKRNNGEPRIMTIHTKHTSPAKLYNFLKRNNDVSEVGFIKID